MKKLKKVHFLLLLVVLSVLLWLPAGLVRADNGPHGDYTATTDACAGCHRAHTASAGRLLLQAVPALCTSCHGTGGQGADTDVIDGLYLERDLNAEIPVEGNVLIGSLKAGGFINALMDTDTDTGTPAISSPATSSHLYGDGGITGTAWGYGDISYESGLSPFNLTCVNCHDPHGGASTTGAATYRLLRSVPTGSGAGSGVDVDDEADKTYTVSDSDKIYMGESYAMASSLASWCSQCHTRYYAESGSGHTDSDDSIFTYRHNTTSVSCVTCHVAHGTTATMGTYSGVVNWPGNAAGPGGNARSSLLRLDNRGVCADCHVDDDGNVIGGACTACHSQEQGDRSAVDTSDFFMSSHLDQGCVGCHDESTTHRDGLLQLSTAGNPIITETSSGDLNVDEFCFQCHTEGMVQNDALANNRPGGYVSADDIEEAFSTKSAVHNLGDAFSRDTDTFTIQCTSCHNPHVVTGRYWDADLGVTPVTRPDFSDPVNNPRAMGNVLWGDIPGEKMDDFAASGSGTGGWYYNIARGYSLGASGLPYDQNAVYRPPKAGSGYESEFSGNVLPDYTSLCLDCHTYRVNASIPPVNWGQGIGCTDNSVDPPDQRVECGAQHGLGAAGRPSYISDNGTAGFWGSSGNPDVLFDMNFVTRGRNNGHFMRWPYDSADRSAGINFVMSCTDCHEAHGSNRGGMVRERFNVNANGDCGTGGDANPNGENCTDGGNWNSFCNACHYYYGGQHAGMSCGNASCHEANSIHRIIHTVDSGAGTQLMLTAAGYEADYQRPDFTPEIESVIGSVGSPLLNVTFTEGVFTNMDLTGALIPEDFVLTDKNGNNPRTILSVLHSPGDNEAILLMSADLAESDLNTDILATRGVSVWNWDETGYFNQTGTWVDPSAVSAGPWPVKIWDGLTTSFQLNEPAGSTTASDESGRIVATVNNPGVAFTGDGYFHGDGSDDSTYIYYENTEAYLDEGRTFTWETRFKPNVIDLDSEENNPGNTLDRTMQVLFERRYTYNIKISRADFWGDNNPPPGKAFIYIWYHPNNQTEGGRRWHQAFANGTEAKRFYIEQDHWYQMKLVYNADKEGGIPVDFFLDDQGPNGDDTGEAWSGYRNCTSPPGETDTYRSTEGNEVEPVSGHLSYPISIGAYAENKNYALNGQMDWITYRSVADYSGVDAPAPVESVAGDSQVTISWAPVPGASSYNIYWDTSSGVSISSNQITGETSPYIHSGLTNGTTYYYIVTAMKDVDGVAGYEEIASSEVKAMPVNTAPSSPPTNVVAEGFKGKVTLTWDYAPLATLYNIYWGTSPGVTTSSGTLISGATSPYVHVGRTNGTTYYYVITSVNFFGEHPVASGEVSAVPNQHPKDVVTEAGDQQVTLTWTDVGADSYNIFWETDPEVTRATATQITGVTSPYTHSGLTNGTRYYYILTAVYGTEETFGPYPVNATPIAP